MFITERNCARRRRTILGLEPRPVHNGHKVGQTPSSSLGGQDLPGT